MNPRSDGQLAVCAALVLVLGSACGDPSRPSTLLPDCSADDAYDLKRIATWDQAMPAPPFFAAPDTTPGAVASWSTADPYPEDACGAPAALHIVMARNQDWGAVVGTYAALTSAEGDASGYEGLSFWAKAPYDKGFILLLSDAQTDEQTTRPVAEGGCDPSADIDENGVSRPEECGNLFQTLVVVTDWWQFYTIPWRNFWQEDRPNRRPDGIDTSAIYDILVRAPKDTTTELWFDDFAWYRSPSPN